MADLRGFNAAEVEPEFGFDPLPAGKYVAAIVESDFKPNKAGTGHYLELKFQVLEGQHQGRNIWARLNLRHPNAATVKFAQAELSAVCRAVGVLQPKDSIELHDLPIEITVKCKRREDTGEVTNEISGYAKRTSGAAAPAPAGAAASNTPPWKR